MRASQCVVYSRKRGTWHFKWFEEGKPHSKQLGTIRELPSRKDAEKAAAPFRKMLLKPVQVVPKVSALVEGYKAEKMPERYSTRRAYEVWLNGYIIPKWGDALLTDLQARPVELWLTALDLAPKSRSHIRGLVRTLWDFAMWHGDVPTQRNPIELVTVKGASKRMRHPRSLTVEEFQKFVQHLSEPFHTIALVCVCFGLRISECLALRWSDVDWLKSKLSVERGIVKQRVGDVKTSNSQKHLSIDSAMLELLKIWKQTTQFSSQDDWMFASPAKLGRQPWSYDQVLRSFVKAGADAGIGRLGTHSMRHTYRSWLDAVGTQVAVQQKLMRHADIRTTMNVYGDVVTDEMSEAHSKVVQLALSKN